MLGSISDAGSDLRIYLKAASGLVSINSNKKSIVADATRKDFLTNEVVTPITLPDVYDWANDTTKNYFLYLDRSTGAGGSAVAEIDYTQLFIGDFLYTQQSGVSTSEIIIHGNKAIQLNSGTHESTKSIIGKAIDLYPNKLNQMVIISADLGGDTAFTRTVTLTRTFVIPRWSIL